MSPNIFKCSIGETIQVFGCVYFWDFRIIIYNINNIYGDLIMKTLQNGDFLIIWNCILRDNKSTSSPMLLTFIALHKFLIGYVVSKKVCSVYLPVLC